MPLVLALTILLMAASCAAAAPCAAGPAAQQIEEEIAALRAEVDATSVGGPLTSEWKSALPVLAEAEAAAAAGRPYLALARLTTARLLLRPLRFVAQRAPDPAAIPRARVDEGVATITAALDAASPELARPSPPTLPLAVRAMRDEARVQAPVYARTTRAWSGIGDGLGALYYGAQGLELARIASFDAGLRFPAVEPSPLPSLAVLGRTVDELERRLTAAYAPPVSTERHADFIRASAAVKSAREILAAGSAEGALYAALQARRHAAAIERAARPVPSLEELRRTVSDGAARRSAARTDVSLSCLFGEQAAALLEGSDVPEDRRRAAAVLLQDVIPELERLLAGAPAPGSIAATPARGKVHVTLVRWPYT